MIGSLACSSAADVIHSMPSMGTRPQVVAEGEGPILLLVEPHDSQEIVEKDAREQDCVGDS